MNRRTIQREKAQKVLKFPFRADVRIFRPEWGQRTGVMDLEGNIWEAGGEASGVILGVSFATAGGKGRIWLDSLHTVDLAKRSRTELGDGLLIETASSVKAK